MKKLSLAAIVAAFVIGVSPAIVSTPAAAADMAYEEKGHDCFLLWPFHVVKHILHLGN